MLSKIQNDVFNVLHFKGKTKTFAFALTFKECDENFVLELVIFPPDKFQLFL